MVSLYTDQRGIYWMIIIDLIKRMIQTICFHEILYHFEGSLSFFYIYQANERN